MDIRDINPERESLTESTSPYRVAGERDIPDGLEDFSERVASKRTGRFTTQNQPLNFN